MEGNIESTGKAMSQKYQSSVSYRDRDIHVSALITDRGMTVAVVGGDSPHIGAVSIADKYGQHEINYSGHRDNIISSKWASEICQSGYYPVVVSVGIHYDNVSKNEINDLLKKTDGLLDNLLQHLEETQDDNSTL